MKKKRITIIIFTIYLAFIFLYPLLRGSIAHINGYPSYFEKILKCINIIPFYFDYTVMPSVIIKNIILFIWDCTEVIARNKITLIINNHNSCFFKNSILI